MLTLEVNFDDAAARGGIAALKALAENRRGLHEVMATVVGEGVAARTGIRDSRQANHRRSTTHRDAHRPRA
jgi:hypothetical protein